MNFDLLKRSYTCIDVNLNNFNFAFIYAKNDSQVPFSLNINIIQKGYRIVNKVEDENNPVVSLRLSPGESDIIIGETIGYGNLSFAFKY